MTSSSPSVRGYIDSVTTLGYLEGWAFDTDQPAKPLTVSVRLGEEEIAWGLAHRFRADLMEAGYGVGWCAFRLSLQGLIGDVQAATLRLVERDSGVVIHTQVGVRLIEDGEPAAQSVADALATDPTLITGVWQLKRCDPLFVATIAREGIEGFLSTTYAYMLGRPLDADGLELYAGLLRKGSLTPVGVLAALEASDEFRTRPRTLAAPSAPNFPFLAPP